MQFVVDKREKLSNFGLRVAVGSVAAVGLLSILDGVLRGPFALSVHDFTSAAMWMTWFTDFRYLFEQLVYAGAIVFIGAKFIETRSVFTIGFDNLDKAKVSMKGPDEDNIVWIGHRYGSRMEAEVVASTIKSRLEEATE